MDPERILSMSEEVSVNELLLRLLSTILWNGKG
jgi:hypothetical protein